MNDVMSLAIHRLWKDYLLMKLSPTNATNLLDVCGGTGKNLLNNIINLIITQQIENNIKWDCLF